MPDTCSGDWLYSPWFVVYGGFTVALLGCSALHFDGRDGAKAALGRRICLIGGLLALLLAVVGFVLASRSGVCVGEAAAR